MKPIYQYTGGISLLKKISIIVPLYNKGPHIKRTISSVLKQTYENFELIIVNDGSTDSGPDIVRDIKDKRIRLINQKNSGVSSARNMGVSEAKNDLIAFIDADDEWEPYLLETFVNMINKYPEARMIGCAYWIVNKESQKKVPNFYHVPTREGIIENYFKAAIKTNPTSSSAVLIYKEVFNQVGGFPVNLKRGEDSLLWCKIALEYPVAFVNTPLAINYHDAVNRATSNDSQIDDFPLFDYIEKKKLKLDKDTEYFASEYAYKKYLIRASQCLKIGNKIKAKDFLLKAKSTKQFKKRRAKIKIISLLPNFIRERLWN